MKYNPFRISHVDFQLIEARLLISNMAMAKLTLMGFAIGLSFGIFITYVSLNYYHASGSFRYILKRGEEVENDDTDVHGHSALSKPERPKNLRIASKVNFSKDMDDEHHKQGSNPIDKIKVLCWIMTSPKSIYKKGKAVKETWGKRCDILLFMSSKEDKSFPAIGLDVPEGHENLWYKTRAAWQYVFDHHLNDAEWFLKADDDTYVIVENLKYLCSKYDPEKPYYLGRYFDKYGGYNSGGAGYVFSKETLRRFVNILQNPIKCARKSTMEDVEVGKCLANVGVHPEDTRDSRQRETFHPLRLLHHLVPSFSYKNSWMHDFSPYPVQTGPDCCADHSVSFHYIDRRMMYQMEYFVYHLTPYGIEHHD